VVEESKSIKTISNILCFYPPTVSSSENYLMGAKLQGFYFSAFAWSLPCCRFSIVPLSATALNVTFHLANKAADAVVQILQNPLPLCILECRACVLQQLQKFKLQNSGGIEQTYQSSSTEKVQSSSTEKVLLGKSWGSTLKAGNWKQISQHSKSYQDSYYSVDPDGFRG
jgi:hypothetical protein